MPRARLAAISPLPFAARKPLMPMIAARLSEGDIFALYAAE